MDERETVGNNVVRKLRAFLGSAEGREFEMYIIRSQPTISTGDINEAALTGAKAKGYLQCLDDMKTLANQPIKE